MLTSLKIQNLALINQAEIEFSPGFNVLTGKTGAGKSIILGSFNFILGERLEKDIIRSGAASARVDAVFTAQGTVLSELTERSGIEFDDNTVILSRTLKLDGRNECRINGTTVTTKTLGEAAGYLIQIHGQRETESLLKSKNHLEILDNYGGAKIHGIKAEYAEQYQKLQELRAAFKAFGGSDDERKRLIDMYEFQINEIENAHIHENEDEELGELKNKMLNFEKIHTNLNRAMQCFSDLGFGEIKSALSVAARFDSKIEKILESAKSVQYDIDEIESSVKSYMDGFEFDEKKFEKADARLDEIKVLKRKYGGSLPQVFAFLAQTRAELDFLTRSAENIEQTRKQIDAQERVVSEYALKLRSARQSVAQVFESELVNQLKDLGMQSSKVHVKFTETKPSNNGADDAEFFFTANAGEEIKPLVNIISGGEMSRFMLALKTVTAKLGGTGTLVFDEIDAGVGGVMGIKIAQKLVHLSKTAQIICVTHLPQITAMGENHFLIQKNEIHGKTITEIKKLNSDEQIVELARMLGSAAPAKTQESESAANETLTDKTAREHAIAMKEWSKTMNSDIKV